MTKILSLLGALFVCSSTFSASLGELAKDLEGTPVHMSFQKAQEYCQSLGKRLPTRQEYMQLYAVPRGGMTKQTNFPDNDYVKTQIQEGPLYTEISKNGAEGFEPLFKQVFLDTQPGFGNAPSVSDRVEIYYSTKNFIKTVDDSLGWQTVWVTIEGYISDVNRPFYKKATGGQVFDEVSGRFAGGIGCADVRCLSEDQTP